MKHTVRTVQSSKIYQAISSSQLAGTVPDRLKCCLKIWVRLFRFEESWAWWSKRRIEKVKSRLRPSQHFRLVQSCIWANILGILDTVARAKHESGSILPKVLGAESLQEAATQHWNALNVLFDPLFDQLSSPDGEVDGEVPLAIPLKKKEFDESGDLESVSLAQAMGHGGHGGHGLWPDVARCGQIQKRHLLTTSDIFWHSVTFCDEYIGEDQDVPDAQVTDRLAAKSKGT